MGSWQHVPSLGMAPPARPFTGAVPVSLLSAGHADDFQRSQGAGAALQAEGEGWGAEPGGPGGLSSSLCKVLAL